jgi:hypothetical protein
VNQHGSNAKRDAPEEGHARLDYQTLRRGVLEEQVVHPLHFAPQQDLTKARIQLRQRVYPQKGNPLVKSAGMN